VACILFSACCAFTYAAACSLFPFAPASMCRGRGSWVWWFGRFRWWCWIGGCLRLICGFVVCGDCVGLGGCAYRRWGSWGCYLWAVACRLGFLVYASSWLSTFPFQCTGCSSLGSWAVRDYLFGLGACVGKCRFSHFAYGLPPCTRCVVCAIQFLVCGIAVRPWSLHYCMRWRVYGSLQGVGGDCWRPEFV
jgi:hypothetical protein